MLFFASTLFLLAYGIDRIHDKGYSFNNLLLLLMSSAIVLVAMVEMIVAIVKDELKTDDG